MRTLLTFLAIQCCFLLSAQNIGDGYLIQLQAGTGPMFNQNLNSGVMKNVHWKLVNPELRIYQIFPVREHTRHVEYSIPVSDKDIFKPEYFRHSLPQNRIPDTSKAIRISPLFQLTEDEALFALRSIPEIIEAQKNHKIEYRRQPDDSLFFRQWHFFSDGSQGGIAGVDINAHDAWDIATGGRTDIGNHEIVVCVVDGGTDISHPDLQGNLWINKAEIPGNSIDDDGNTYVDDVYGWNTYEENSDVTDSLFGIDVDHGTAVAGIIGAKGNNSIGVTGINWDSKIMTVVGGGDEANALASYNYPLVQKKRWIETKGKEGAYVVAINSSWGTDRGMAEDAPLWCAMYDTLGAYGIVNAGATANRDIDVDIEGDLPTTCPSDFLISVTNTTKTDIKDSRAAYGLEHIDLGAPGTNTFSLNSLQRYDGFGGTSSATPHVTGSIALLYSKPESLLPIYQARYPKKAAQYARDLILQHVEANNSLEGRTTTGGRLNLGASMAADVPSECREDLDVDIQFNAEKIEIDWNDADIPFLSTRITYAEFEDSSQVIYGITPGYVLGEDLEQCTDFGTLEIWKECPDSSIAKVDTIISLRTGACVGTEEILSEVSIYPNPAQDLLQIKMPEGHRIGRILNASGMTMKVGQEQLSNVVSIDVSSFPTGVYFIELYSESGKAFTEFIKL